MTMNEILRIDFLSEFKLLKSFGVFQKPNSTIEEVKDIIPKIEPFSDGGTFLVRKDIILKPGDKVVVGLASSPDVDLVNDAIIDIAETFGDYIEDFLKSGRVFYEHGYKLVGKTNPNDMYDVPLGIPIAVQYNKSKLYVWILLDMNHPLARKVYSVLSNQDERVARTFGLSIGAIPLGTGYQKTIDGRKVNVPPKMRLYEVSFTGQPINTETWSKIVKSLVYNNETKDTASNLIEEENMKKESKKLKALDVKDPNVGNEDDSVMEPNTDKEEGSLLSSSNKDSMRAFTDTGTEETAGENSGSSGDAVLSDLLSDTESTEKEEDTSESFSNDLVLDKLDMLSSRMQQLEEMLNKLMDMEKVENQATNPNAVEDVMRETQMVKSGIEKLNKSLDVLKDNVEMLSHMLKSLQTAIVNNHDELKSAVNKKFEAVQKSFLQQDTTMVKNKAVVGVGVQQHPALGNNFEEKNQDFEVKIKSILSDKGKLAVLKSMYDSYRKFKGSPIEISNFENKLYEKAEKELGLSEDEIKRVFKELKMRGN